MKQTIYILAIIITLGACKKQNVVETPVFDVSTEKTSYKVNTDIVFNFTGNPDLITFFSGEKGYNYEYADRITAAGIPKLQFSSARANGSQPNSLALLVSSDFAGVVTDTPTTVSNIGKATWTDITSRATLSTGATTASGAIDLTDIAATKKPVYLAFKYTAAAGSIQNKWTITGLTVTNTLPDASVYTIANLTKTAITNYTSTTNSPGWVSYRVSNNYNWVITSGSSLVITGAATAPTATAPAESWTVMGPLDLTRVTHDAGLAVKEISARMPGYTYQFKTAGTYNVTWVGANATIYGRQEVIKKMQLTITP